MGVGVVTAGGCGVRGIILRDLLARVCYLVSIIFAAIVVYTLCEAAKQSCRVACALIFEGLLDFFNDIFFYLTVSFMKRRNLYLIFK